LFNPKSSQSSLTRATLWLRSTSYELTCELGTFSMVGFGEAMMKLASFMHKWHFWLHHHECNGKGCQLGEAKLLKTFLKTQLQNIVLSHQAVVQIIASQYSIPKFLNSTTCGYF
jgi:hypothetical protein